MSKAAKQSILILVILLCAATVFSAITTSQKAALEKQKATLENEVDGYKTRELTHLKESNDLKQKVKDIEQAKADLEQKLGTIGRDIPNLL